MTAVSADTWKAFLAQQGALIGDDGSVAFGDPRSETRSAATTDILADLTHLSLIRASGPDSRDFLQGQLTNDIRQVTESHTQLSAYCTPKGRMLAVFRIGMREGCHVLQVPAALRDATLNRLRMYVLRAKVSLESTDDRWLRIGLAGPNSGALLGELELAVPDAPDAAHSDGGITTIRLRGPHPRFELIAEPDVIRDLWTRLRPHTAPAAHHAWAWLDIMAGVPTILPATSEAFVPQMANLDVLGGVSFKKGCYPGQEIVARMHYLGRLKQRMIRAHVQVADAPQPGDPVYAPDLPGQSSGTVVDAQPAPTAGYDLLAVVHLSSLAAGELHLSSADGPLLTVAKLPYTIDSPGA